MQLVGKTYKFTFDSASQGTFVVEEGGGLAPDGQAETVALDLKKIRDSVHLNSWTEASGATVTHVEDFANATLDRYWAEPYVQHSPQLPNGLDTLRAAVPGLQGSHSERTHRPPEQQAANPRLG